MTRQESLHTKKYEQVYEYIKTYIEQQRFTENTRIPSENYLCKKLCVSRETVRTAIALLVEEGVVYAVKGSGTFFNKKRVLMHENLPENGELKIGVIVQGQDHNANSNLLKGIRSALSQRSVELKIFYTDNKLRNERKCLLACSKGFHGLIVDGVKASMINFNLDCYSALYEKDIPIIFYNNYYAGASFPKVTIADGQCADELVKRLTDNGHRHIAGIFVYDNYQGIEKYKGYVRALQKYGATYDDSYVKWFISDDTFDEKEVSRSLWNFLKTLPKCSAIVCCNFMILKCVLRLLAKHDKSIPKDYSIVSFDYSDTDWQQSGITCSVHPGFEMGFEVGKRIYQMICDNEYKIHDYSFTFKPTIFNGSSIQDIRTKEN
ncbi:GntR family transcriptional regulator [Sphaerochaeta sp. PS]|uniref:GntR family transcriptional regulator n=1 Tax=Sphaerochaeta sp. PS TaxID=3076336 RepID=UPI0028A2EA14|nr:GntR family transcriptional regulator [Sphaerochaeta sp. PS]MDT4762197.1 GntR family transcriptional regulator [Sphaerochaeta sp. PS]